MEINGLPLHPLVVHAAVVFTPLAALLALGYAVPRWRDRLRWPLLVGAVLAVGAVVAAYLTGEHFRSVNDFMNQPPLDEKIDEHAAYARQLLWATVGFGVVAVLNVLLHASSARWLRVLLIVLLVVDAIAVLVLVFLTGEAGARSVWGGTPG
jgi:hypothetical protein